MIDTFYIGGYWKDRKQSLVEIIAPTLQTLNELKAFDKQFLNLYELGTSRKQALEKNVLLTPDHIEKLYKERLRKTDFDNEGYSKIGFRLSLWTGHAEGEASTISINAGSSSARITDLCLIKLPFEGLVKDRLLRTDSVKEIINIIIRNWNPDIVVLNSKKLSDAIDTLNEIGWVTYLKKLKSKHRFDKQIIHEDTVNGGHIFYLQTATGLSYDYEQINQLSSLKEALVK